MTNREHEDSTPAEFANVPGEPAEPVLLPPSGWYVVSPWIVSDADISVRTYELTYPHDTRMPYGEPVPSWNPPGGLFGWSEMVCWIFVLGFVSFLFWFIVSQQLGSSVADGEAGQKQGHLLATQLNGKILVFSHRRANAILLEDTFEHISPPVIASRGSLLERYAGVILEAEVISPQSATRLFAAIDRDIRDHGYQPTEMEVRIRKVLEEVMRRRAQTERFDSSVIAEEDRAFLIQKFGWLGKLVLTPANSTDAAARAEIERTATTTTVSFLGMILLGVILLLVGLILAIVGTVLTAMGKIYSHTADWSGSGPIYLETFALWLLIFFAMQFLLPLLGISQQNMMALLPLVFFGSLVVLVWPLARGRTLAQLCEDLGLSGRAKLVHGIWGFPCYVAILPAVVLAAYVNWSVGGLLVELFRPPAGPFDPTQAVGHPLQEELAGTGSWAFWSIVLSLCIAAPMVEEIFFRGVFYRYLRDRFARCHRVLGIALSALISSVIFASIHPQGIMGILLLATLAFGMALAREWRGSLYPSIVMHSINNSFVTVLLLIIVYG